MASLLISKVIGEQVAVSNDQRGSLEIKPHFLFSVMDFFTIRSYVHRYFRDLFVQIIEAAEACVCFSERAAVATEESPV
jgi:hypothetical protein